MNIGTTKQFFVLSFLGTAVATNVFADAPANVGTEKSYTGEVVSVNPQNNSVCVKSWMFSKKNFNVDDHCAYSLWNVQDGNIQNLRPGQRIAVTYQDYRGFRIADRIEERSLEFQGTVGAIDSKAHTLTLHQPGLDKEFVIGTGCNISLLNEKPGALSDVYTGENVIVRFDIANDSAVVRQISESSLAFTGRLTAINPTQRNVKAESTFEKRQFRLAKDCTILVDGKNAKLNQLSSDEELVFTYQNVHGVNVVTRIAPAPLDEPQNELVSADTSYPPYPYSTYPTGY